MVSTSKLILHFKAIKQRLQLCNTLTARQAFRDILKEGGIKMLYKSYPITVLMNVPFASTVVCCNENLKTMTKPWERQNPLGWYFLCAGISGAVAGFITNPFDVVKTRL
jgi:solute carrier family 25 iron transporter 28/37